MAAGFAMAKSTRRCYQLSILEKIGMISPTGLLS